MPKKSIKKKRKEKQATNPDRHNQCKLLPYRIAHRYTMWVTKVVQASSVYKVEDIHTFRFHSI